MDGRDWDIPELDPGMQAESLVLPMTRWGSQARSRPMAGTYHFYTDDRVFSAVWKVPGRLPASGCAAAVEPNYSTYPGQPRAAALWDVYRKRWLARSWQARGVRIWVDLNLGDESFRPLALLGVPRGWLSYATRKHRGVPVEDIEGEHRWACEHAGTDDVRFLVVGGHLRMRRECEARGWLWCPEPQQAERGTAPPPVDLSLVGR